MSQSGEAAEQIVNTATTVTLKGLECVSNLAGKGALSLATFLIAVIKDEKRTKGKARMRVFNGKPTKVFVIRAKDMKTFAIEAKKYGVLYAAVFNKSQKDGLVDVIVNAADAAKVNRISERFALSTVDVEKIREEIQQSREQREKAKNEKEEPTQQKQEAANDVSLNEKQAEQKMEPITVVHVEEQRVETQNPTKTRKEKTSLSVDTYGKRERSETESSERSSVREMIQTIREERKQETNERKTQLRNKVQINRKSQSNKGR